MKNRFPSLLLASISVWLLCQTPLHAQSPTNWSFNYTGSITTWNVPQAGNYTITAYGAQGGVGYENTAGGLGAVISGLFPLSTNQALNILVGGQGGAGYNPATGVGKAGGGGGGGTFVVDTSNSPLVVAGGGGGGASVGTFSSGGLDASTNTTGTAAVNLGGYQYQGSGGSNGSGGTIGSQSYDNGGGGGGGWVQGDGGNGGTHYTTSVFNNNTMLAQGGYSYLNGGAGGQGGSSDNGIAGAGGFGGGGGGGSQGGVNYGGGGGGGGGYSGGGGGGDGGGPDFFNSGGGGGGGSFLAANATNALKTIGNTGYGQVKISQGQVITNWTFNYTGSITSWTVPRNGNYTITAFGAQGGNSNIGNTPTPGGLGSVVSGTFQLTYGQSLDILVGGKGQSVNGTDKVVPPGGGGGGGTYVVLGTLPNVTPSSYPMVAAGGGGGASSYAGGAASLTATGGSAFPGGGSGGSTGYGGTIGTAANGEYGGGGGGGWVLGNGGNGGTQYANGQMLAQGGFGYLNGGAGGQGGISQYVGSQSGGSGGFGGGGGGGGYIDTVNYLSGGGGGGGYSGGGAGSGFINGGANPGGGGGSFLSENATNGLMSLGNTGDGVVTISLLDIAISEIWGGNVIRNLPTTAVFYLTEATRAIGASNTISALTFTNNASLTIDATGLLTVNSGNLNVQTGTSVITGGTLTTLGNFSKTGSGALVLQNKIVVGGTASIDAGLLSVSGQLFADAVVVGDGGNGGRGGLLTVNGQLTANSVAVNQGGMLGGSGTIFAPVTVSGTLAPGNSPGTLSMAALTLTPSAVTDIEIQSFTNFDRIVVGGAATVDGTLNVMPYNGNPLAYGQQHAFLTAGGGISGKFDTINSPATFRGRFLNLGTTGVLLIAPDTYTRVAVTPNQREVAKALDSFIPTTSGDRETVSIALDLQTAEQYPYAFEQVMPGFYESLANIAIEQTYNQAQLISQRLGCVRLGATGFQAIGLNQPIKYDKNGKSASDAKTASPIVEAPANTKWNSWVIANGEFSLSRGLSGVPNYNNNAGGFLVGADYRLSENFAAGLFAGYEYSYAKYNGGSSTAGNSALFGLYGSYTHEDGYYADAIVGGGYTGFQTRRSIQFSAIDRTARANPNSGQFSAAVNLGKDFEVGKFTLGPIVGAQYTYAGIGGFTETGAESLDLALGQQNANSLRSNLGARLAYNWEVGSKITLIPEVRGFWMHEFLNNPRNINSTLDGGSGPSFGYETAAPYANSVFGGVGLSAKFGDRWTTSVFFNVNFGAEGYTNNIISTSLELSF